VKYVFSEGYQIIEERLMNAEVRFLCTQLQQKQHCHCLLCVIDCYAHLALRSSRHWQSCPQNCPKIVCDY